MDMFDDDEGTEAEYLESQSDGGAEHYLDGLSNFKAIIDGSIIEKMKKEYNKNKLATVGSKCTCPTCGKQFTKQRKNQAFPSGHTKCKDGYWNVADEKRMLRTNMFNRG